MAISDLLTKKNIDNAIIIISASISAFFFAELGCDFVRNSFWEAPSMNISKITIKDVSKQESTDYLSGISSILRYDKGSAKNIEQGSIGNNLKDSVTMNDAVLKGILTGDSGGLAVIFSNGSEHVLTKGDMVGSNKIVEIYDDRILLRSEGGRISELALGYGASLKKVQPDESILDSYNSNGDNREVSKREFLELFDPPDKLMKGIQLSPQSKDGSPYGIKITYLDPKSFMASKMGLIAGDVILSINNKPLYTPEDGMAAYLAMKTEDEIVFKLDRGGTISNLKVIFR